MKKLTCFVFAVCLLLCTAASADEGVLFENTAPAELSWTNAAVADMPGIGGKEYDDVCAYIGMADGQTSAYYQYDSVNGRFDDAFKGNYVILIFIPVKISRAAPLKLRQTGVLLFPAI